MFPKIQIDTAIAYFILTTFGESAFPGVSKAPLEFWTEMPKDVTLEDLESQGHIFIDLGMSKFDHHSFGLENKTITSALLIAQHLGVADRPDLQKLLELARRDDLEGKGTLSADPIDRAFGISALLTNLNKSMPNDSQAVLDLISPLITAHFLEENRRHEIFPQEYKQLQENGLSQECTIKQNDRPLKLIYIRSDNTALAGYLRSKAVSAAVVIQQTSLGHVNFVTNQNANVKITTLVRLIREKEAEKNSIRLNPDEIEKIDDAGRLPSLPHWFYDNRANTLQNGGVNPQGIPPTALSTKEILELAIEGLNLESIKSPSNNTKTNYDNPKITKGKGVLYLD